MSVQFSRGHALLIGVGGADIPHTVDDAAGLADILRDPGRGAYPPQQVHLLTAEAATRDGILAALGALAQQAQPDATVVVYFSGHGYEAKSGIGRSYFLLPHGYDAQNLMDTAVSGRELTQALLAIPQQKLLLLLDCCHAGGLDDAKAPGAQLTKAPLPPEAEQILAQGSGRVVIASSRADELSFAGKPYSAFTLALIEALSGEGVARKDGYVRVADLAGHAREKVPQRTHNRQHPILNFEQADNFAVAYYAGGDATPKGVPFAVTPEIEDEPGAFARQGGPSYAAKVGGGGAIAQGPGSTAVGERGVNIGGNVGGPIITGSGNVIHTGRAAGSAASLPPELAELRNKLTRYFNKSELKGLCFDLGVAHDDLPSETRTELAQALVAYCYARDRLPELRQRCRAERPRVAW